MSDASRYSGRWSDVASLQLESVFHGNDSEEEVREMARMVSLPPEWTEAETAPKCALCGKDAEHREDAVMP